MNKRDTPRIKHENARGILNVALAESNGLSRYWPSGDLSPFVEHYWIVRWDLDEPQVAETVPHPSVHMVLEPGRAEIVGVMRCRFTRVLEGRSRVIGTKFRTGAFRAFVSHPVSLLTDRRVPVARIFGPRAERLGQRALRHDADLPAIAAVETFLRGCRPAHDDAIDLVGRMAARIAHDRGITRVHQLAAEFETSVRQLQRLFSEYVGVGPKWVIRRYRLLEAVERVVEGTTADWTALAFDLGYADQAHFIRDFRKLVGRPPAEYSRRLQLRGQAR